MDKILNFVLRTAVFIVATMPHILELLNQSKNGKSEILELPKKLRPKGMLAVALLLNSYFDLGLMSFAYGQLGFESAGFTDYKWIDHNNPSGMKPSSKRFSVGQIKTTVGLEGQVTYKTKADGIYDYVLRQVYYKMPKQFADASAFASWNKKTQYFQSSTSAYAQGVAKYAENPLAWGVFTVALVLGIIGLLCFLVCGRPGSVGGRASLSVGDRFRSFFGGIVPYSK